MPLSDALFHLVSMQEKATRDGEAAQEKASRKNAAKGDRDRWNFLAQHHREEAQALDIAIAALLP